GVCFEAQHYPASPHHAAFPSVVLQPGKEYQSTIKYNFIIKKEVEKPPCIYILSNTAFISFLDSLLSQSPSLNCCSDNRSLSLISWPKDNSSSETGVKR